MKMVDCIQEVHQKKPVVMDHHMVFKLTTNIIGNSTTAKKSTITIIMAKKSTITNITV
ncbi:unnamed protein product [Acanthoscelides obtectus]|uniref:Uncharacterized protein n=1 Tax=Acanthoscelides obtectus TaxID=200917 RepID=A0A9P0Q795_ACAOB|nr:unnamed protein product [Acanthoscelides obtectus]CAK1658354.1 hypothetical protein AOBTE_LOCUS20841 [Acanthoscelides obtectus]